MEYLESAVALEALAERLKSSDLLAADTEAAGYHRYRDRVCLLQLSTRSETFVVDTLAIERLEPLAPIFGDEKREVLFHDADYDLRLLNRDFGLRIGKLFDTKIAAQFLGEPAIGLGALVEKYLAITLDKKHQRADWGQRPLPPELLDYAAEDTRHLPPLRDKLRDLLEQAGRLRWAEEEFRLMQKTRWTGEPATGDGFLKVKGARDLNGRQLAALRELHGWREQVAEGRDSAPFRIISNEALLELARALPASMAELTGTRGISGALIEKRGTEMIAAIGRALDLPEQDLPAFPRGPRRPPPDPNFDDRMERLRGARDKVADELVLDRGFLMPRMQLEAIARLPKANVESIRSVADMRAWQVEVLGEPLAAALTPKSAE
jgi:ribonuclease D